MPEGRARQQQLYASNRSVNIAEALAARVKDPLWFLARQWQTGEFEAENGGKPAGIELRSRHFRFREASLGAKSVALDPHAPLEALVEAEAAAGDAPAWRSEALEYGFEVLTDAQRLRASDYGGRMLDWHHFDLAKATTEAGIDDGARQFVPTQLHFRGAPHPRWWRMEEGEAYFDAAADPEPNVLSMLLPEFFFTDINNWYVVPAPMPSGAVREITALTVTDSFGVTTSLDAAGGGGWRLFAVDGPTTAAPGLEGRFLLAPNVAIDILHNDPVEDVRFIRDEDANLVWAWEHLYHDPEGRRVVNGDGATGASPTPGAPEDELPAFRLVSQTPPYWIPYVPRRLDPGGVPMGEIYLRRARTIESATPENPQHRSQIVAESRRLNEEEVPQTGLRVRRIARFARGSDGSMHFWVGRVRDAGRSTAGSNLRFDYLERGRS